MDDDSPITHLIASKIFDQGVDIPNLDALVLAGSGKSSGRALQRIGRVIRNAPGKKKAIVVEEWLFTEEERAPMGFIYLFFMNIAISTAICLFILAYKGVM